MNQQNVLLRQERRIDGTAVTLILCLITHIFINLLIIIYDGRLFVIE